MTDLEFIIKPEPPVVEWVGPFRGDLYKLVVDGCKVPNIELYKRGDTPDYEWTICLDERFEIDTTEDELVRWGWMLANAMAISAGFTYHGPNSRPLNPHNCRMTGLREVPNE